MLIALALPAVGQGARVKRQVLSHPGFISTWAYLETATDAYAAPSRHARVLGYLGLTTQDGTSELLLEQERVLVRGAWWVQVRLPLRPAGQIGWVPERTLGAPQTVHTYAVVSTEHADAARAVLRPRPAHGLPARERLRPPGVRHLGAVQRRDRLARRWRGRDPRHQRAVAYPGTSLPWLHSPAQLGDRPARQAHADRHPTHDRIELRLAWCRGQASQ